MIGRLTGRVTQEDDGTIVVDVNGVGYEAIVPLGTIGRAKTAKAQGPSRPTERRGMASPKIAIIGAGMGGMAAAGTLRQAGIEVEIYEQAHQFGRIGAGIQMLPNSMKVLRGLGVRRCCASVRLRLIPTSTGSATPANSSANCRCRRSFTARPSSACIAPTCTMR